MLDGLGRNLIAGSADRGDGGNLKGNVVSEGLEGLSLSGLGLLEGELDEDADLTTHVDVRSERAVLSLTGSEAGDLHVLAHDVNHLGELGGNGLLAHRLLEQSVDVSRLGGSDNLSDLGSKASELGVGSNEVGLAGELEQSAGLAILGDERGDSALVGLTASLLGSLGKAVLTQNVDSGVHVAVSLDESLLALHHRGVGHLAELLDHSGGNLGHCGSFQRDEKELTKTDLLGLGLSGHLGLGDLLLTRASEAGVSHELAHKGDSGDSVIVAGDAVLDLVGIGVGVDQGDDGDVQALSLLDGVLLALGVDDEESLGQTLHVAGATEVGLELGELLAENSLLLLGQNSHAAVLDHGLELLHAVDAGADGDEVGQHTAEPTLVDIRHVGTLSSVLDGLLSLLLGADEQHVAALGDVLDEGVGLVGVEDGLLEVEDVDAVALTEDERLHLGVPATGLVTEVAAGLEQGADINLGSHVKPPVVCLRAGSSSKTNPDMCYQSPGTTV